MKEMMRYGLLLILILIYTPLHSYVSFERPPPVRQIPNLYASMLLLLG